MSLASALYVGRVRHHRFRPKPHALAYRVFWMLLDLDEIDAIARGSRLFSRNRFNLYAFRDADYGDGSGRPLKAQLAEALAAAGIDWDGATARLLTMPRILGYAFNPLSTYFCYARDGELRATVYEVHNTFGETHSYVAPAGSGARPLRRLMQSEIQDRLAMALLSGGVRDGDLVRVDVAADGASLVLTSAGAAPDEGTDAAAFDDDVIEAELLDD